MLEMKSIISSVVRNFEITIAEENKKVVLIVELILRTKDDIKLRFKKREFQKNWIISLKWLKWSHKAII